MNSSYTYFDIARTDLAAAFEMLKASMHNHAVRLCQQYIEKLMKECIHRNGGTESDLFLLHTHRLAKLATRCEEITGIRFTDTEKLFLRTLTDYYFDTNYPGENYVEVTNHDAKEVYGKTLDFQLKHEAKLVGRI